MSLQVWLPLDGDLHNQGLSNIIVTNNGATVNNNGKIGKCYYFNGSAQYLQFNQSLGDIYSGDFSWTVWLKPTDDTRSIIISEYSSSGSSNVAFELTASRAIRVYWNGSPDWTFNTLTKDVWSHVAITKHIDTIKVYINGIETGSKTTTLSARPSTSKIRIGDDYRGGTGVSYMGYMNDVRIYDHCLSAKEVEEIAKGLVLHYKLNDPYIESTTNLFKPKPCTGGENWTASGNGVKIDWAANAKDTYWYLQLADGVTLVQGDTYTFSCRCSGIGSTTVMFRWCNLTGYDIYLHNGWNQYTFSMPSKYITHPFLDDFNSRDASLSNLQIYDFQLEKKGHATPYTSSTRNLNIIYDSSGYNNNGTVTGLLETVTPSPRYGCATYFNGVDSLIDTNNNFDCLNENPFTISIWIHCDDWTAINAEKVCYIISHYNASHGGFRIYSNSGANRYRIYWLDTSGTGRSIYFSATGALTTGWHLFTATYDGTDMRTYLDGIYYTKRTYSFKSSSAPNLQIGVGSSGVPGDYSDFRIYVTALTPDQVKELYNTSMIIENGIIKPRNLE